MREKGEGKVGVGGGGDGGGKVLSASLWALCFVLFVSAVAVMCFRDPVFQERSIIRSFSVGNSNSEPPENDSVSVKGTPTTVMTGAGNAASRPPTGSFGVGRSKSKPLENGSVTAELNSTVIGGGDAASQPPTPSGSPKVIDSVSVKYIKKFMDFFFFYEIKFSQ